MRDDLRQYIIVNKGLDMPQGKLAAQVAHASMSFLTWEVRNNIHDDGDKYTTSFSMDKDLYENWINSSFRKIVLSVNSEKELFDLIKKAEKAGLVEKEDFFKIIDSGFTVFDGIPTFTCIGFRPMRFEKIKSVIGNLPLYR